MTTLHINRDRLLGRLAELVGQTKDDDLEDVNRYASEPAAAKYETAHPDLAESKTNNTTLEHLKA